MRKLLLRILLASILLVSSLVVAQSVAHAATLLSDDFTGTIVGSTNWYMPTWTSSTDGTFLGRTQLRCTNSVSPYNAMPPASNSNASISVQSYNPAGLSFFGSEIISKQSYSVGQGLDITVKAKMDSSTPGVVGGIFLYALKPGSTTLHDEIDYEILTKVTNQVQTNIYGNEVLGAGHTQFIPYATGSVTDFHTYEIKWLPTQVSWYLDGALVRTDTTHVPTGSMNFYLNTWVPDSGWAEAYSSSIQPVTSASSNQTFSMIVDSVNIQSIDVTPVLKTITLSPLTASLIAGGATQQISATSLDQYGSAIASTLTWTSSNPAIATVSATGLVTPVAIGTTNITVTSGGVSSTAPSVITVTKPTPVLKTITLSPLTASLVTGGTTQQITATTLDQYGVAITAPLTWTSSSPAVATVSSTGLVTPVAVGTTNITATSGTVSSTAPAVITVVKSAPVLKTITLSPLTASLTVGISTQQITATTLDQYGLAIASSLTWTSSNPAIATVSATGLVTPVSAGTANITATSGTVSSIAPSVVTVTIPGVQITSVPLLGQVGNATGKVSGMSSSDYSKYAVAIYINVYGGWWTKPSFAAPLTTIQSDGTWTANVTSGGNDIYANQFMAYLVPAGYAAPAAGNLVSLPSSLSAFPSASLTRLIPTTITTAPSSASLTVGGATQQITATVLDQKGNPIATTLSWIALNPAIATVSSTGVVTPVAVGTTDIYASSCGTSNLVPSTITVTKSGPVLKTITLSPSTASLTAGGTTQQITATTLDQYGAAIVVPLTWTSSNLTVATISSTGVVTPVSAGTASITVTSGAVTSTAPAVITVIKPTPALKTITLSPLTASLTVGGTIQQISAITLDQYGSVITASLTWTSSNPAVATVSSTGVVTPVSAGTTNITTASGGITSTAPSVITVVKPAPVLKTITLSPSTASLALCGVATQQISATTLDQYGAVITAPLTWTSSNPAIATVSATGLVTPVSAGTANIIATSGTITSTAPSVITIAKPTPVLKTITLSPLIASLTAGGATQQITATTLDQCGTAIAVTLNWVSTGTAVATVSSTGVVTPVSAGTTNISATSGTITSTAPSVITVVKPAPSLKTITLSPLTASLTAGGATQQITATTLDQYGALITSTLTWKSSNTAIATVSATGLVTPVSAGTANVTATSGTVTSTAPAVITVVKPAPVLKTITLSPLTSSLIVAGPTQQITATTLDQYSAAINSALTWTSSNPAVATVSSTGVVSPVVAGTTNITATSGTVMSSAPSVITVTTPLIQTSNTPQYGQTGNATGYISGMPASYYSKYSVAVFIQVSGGWWNKPYFATPLTTIQADGTWSTNITTGGNDIYASTITAFLVPNSFTVPLLSGATALPSSLSAFPSNTTTRHSLTSLAIVPSAITLTAGGTTQQLSIRSLDQNGVVMIINPVIWTSSNPAVAKVDSFGVVTPVSAGTANITISCYGMTSPSAVVTVLKPAPVLNSISITPLTVNMVMTGALYLTAITLDQYGSPISVPLTWKSSNTAVATVSSVGLVSPVAPGVANITATSGTITSTAPSVITVVKPAPVLTTINLSPLTASLTIGGLNQQITATTLDQNGNPFPTTLTWTSSNPTVASVSSTGLVTPLTLGITQIKATSGLISSSSPSTITVVNPIVQITSVPKLGQTGNASGTITGLAPTNYSKYVVALFIKVAGGWWNKPTWATPYATIQSNGTWSASITTGGNDTSATNIAAYLVPTTFTIPSLSGPQYLPMSLVSFPTSMVSR